MQCIFIGSLVKEFFFVACLGSIDYITGTTLANSNYLAGGEGEKKDWE